MSHAGLGKKLKSVCSYSIKKKKYVKFSVDIFKSLILCTEFKIMQITPHSKVCQEPHNFKAGRLSVCSQYDLLPHVGTGLPGRQTPALRRPRPGIHAHQDSTDDFGDPCSVIPGPLGCEI